MKPTFLVLILIFGTASPAGAMVLFEQEFASTLASLRSASLPPVEQDARPSRAPTPYPTPVVVLESYLPKVAPGAPVLEVRGTGGEVGPLLQRASEALDRRGGKGIIAVSGRGTVSTHPVINHHLIFSRDAVLRCTQQDADYGCIILKDGVLARGNGATIHEPSYHKILADGTRNAAITIFQPYADYTSVQHEKVSQNIAIVDFNFRGGVQTVGDGGARSTAMMGNCHNCAVAQCNFIDTSGIGVNWGGSSSPGGNFAQHVLSYKNTFEGVVAAHEAIVNAKDVIVIGPRSKRPSRKGFTGGVSLLDIEPNTPADFAINIRVFDVHCDYTGAFLSGGAGNCINIQNPGSESTVDDVIVANVVAWGGSPSDPTSRPLSNGVLVTGRIPNLVVSNVTVTKAGQSCVQIDAARGNQTYQDIVCQSCGGGGTAAVTVLGTTGATFVRLKVFDLPGTNVSTDPRIMDCGSGNRFDSAAPVSRNGCPANKRL